MINNYKNLVKGVLVILFLVCACSNTQVEKTTVPAIDNVEATLTPGANEIPKPTIAPTPAKQIPNGLIKETEIKEGGYTILKASDIFPFYSVEYLNSEQKKNLDRMYKGSKWIQEGFEITTPNGDSVLVEKSRIENNILGFSFYVNGERKATVSSSKGVLLELRSVVGEEMLVWGLYDPTNNIFVDVALDPEEVVTLFPYNVLVVEVKEDWTPTTTDSTLDFCKKGFTEKIEGFLLQIFPQEKLEIQKSRVLTYKLINGEIYRWGPTPFPCPYFEITYPQI